MSTKSSIPAKSTPRPSARRRLRADRNGVLIAASIMAGGGWVLLYRLVVTAQPLAFPRWLFFILLYIAVTGTALPLLWDFRSEERRGGEEGRTPWLADHLK